MEKAEGNKDFPGDLQAIKLDLDNLVEQAKDDFADPEDLKSDADSMGYQFMSSHENVTTKEQHAVFGAVSAAKAKISATTSFPHQPDQRKSGSDEAVNDLSGVYVAASVGEALLQAIDNTEDTEERRSFESLLLQWRRARERDVLLKTDTVADRETAERPPDAPVTAAEGTSRPALRPTDQQAVQAVLEAVEVEDF
jgi:hypothetical protein